jgi:hypothetical protein
MRRAPLFLAAVFLLVQIAGLEQYAAVRLGSRDWRGLAFAIALELSIFGASYWTRQSITAKSEKADRRDTNTRIAAVATVILFMLASGTLNTFKTLRDLPAQYGSMDFVGALLFGVCPTLFASVLGILQGYIDRLPVPPAHHATDGLQMRVYALIEKALTLVDAKLSAPAKTKPAQNAGNANANAPALHKCKKCGAKVENLGNHMRWKHPQKKVTK